MEEKCYEVNGPAIIVNNIEYVLERFGTTLPHEIELALKHSLEAAHKTIDWLRELNAVGCKPEVTWTEFRSRDAKRESLKEVLIKAEKMEAENVSGKVG